MSVSYAAPKMRIKSSSDGISCARARQLQASTSMQSSACSSSGPLAQDLLRTLHKRHQDKPMVACSRWPHQRLWKARPSVLQIIDTWHDCIQKSCLYSL